MPEPGVKIERIRGGVKGTGTYNLICLEFLTFFFSRERFNYMRVQLHTFWLGIQVKYLNPKNNNFRFLNKYHVSESGSEDGLGLGFISILLSIFLDDG